MARPEILWPLYGDLTKLPGVGAKTAKLYEKLKVANCIKVPGLLLEKENQNLLTPQTHWPPFPRGDPDLQNGLYRPRKLTTMTTRNSIQESYVPRAQAGRGAIVKNR